MIKEAKIKDDARDAESALKLIEDVLVCKKSVLLNGVAGVYACHARDINDADRHYRQTDNQRQAEIQRVCGNMGLVVPVARRGATR